MKDKLILNLKSLGYRELQEDVWGKPIGYGIFIVRLDKMIFYNWISDVNGNPALWSSDDVPEEDFLRTVKYLEANYQHHGNWNSKYEFNTQIEKIEELLK